MGKAVYRATMYLFALVYAVPLIWMVRTACIPQAQAINLAAVAWPTADNIRRVFDAVPFASYYVNTLIMVAGVLLAQLSMITLAGYAFARLKFTGKNVLFVLMLTQLMVTPDVLMIPNYRLMSQLQLINTRMGVMLPFFASAMGTFLMRQTIKTIPYELEEAARVDGCRFPMLLLRVYMPLLMPCYIAFGLVPASYQWNNFLWPMVMINSVSKRPLTVGLAIFAMSYETGAQWSDVCAATFLVAAPLVVLFVLFQRRFIESFMFSGIK